MIDWDSFRENDLKRLQEGARRRREQDEKFGAKLVGLGKPYQPHERVIHLPPEVNQRIARLEAELERARERIATQNEIIDGRLGEPWWRRLLWVFGRGSECP